MRIQEGREVEWHEVAGRSARVLSSPREGITSSTKRENRGSLGKFPFGSGQARYPGLGGKTYTAKADQDRRLIFVTKTDARTWLPGASKMARMLWEPPEKTSARPQVELEIEQTQGVYCTSRRQGGTAACVVSGHRLNSVQVRADLRGVLLTELPRVQLYGRIRDEVDGGGHKKEVLSFFFHYPDFEPGEMLP